MHTTRAVSGKTRFHHNGDFSGSADVVEVGLSGQQTFQVNVPFADLEEIVAVKKLGQLVSRLEQLPIWTPEGRALLDTIVVAVNGVGADG